MESWWKYKTLWESNSSLWSHVVFEKEVNNCSLKYLNQIRDFSWGLEFKHLKAHNFYDKRVFFFFNYSLATSTTNWVQIFKGLLLFAFDEIHQVSLWQLPKVSSVFKAECWTLSLCISSGCNLFSPRYCTQINGDRSGLPVHRELHT